MLLEIWDYPVCGSRMEKNRRKIVKLETSRKGLHPATDWQRLMIIRKMMHIKQSVKLKTNTYEVFPKNIITHFVVKWLYVATYSIYRVKDISQLPTERLHSCLRNLRIRGGQYFVNLSFVFCTTRKSFCTVASLQNNWRHGKCMWKAFNRTSWTGLSGCLFRMEIPLTNMHREIRILKYFTA